MHDKNYASTDKIIMVLTGIAAASLCALCLLLPVVQWVSIPEHPMTKWAIGVASLAFGICKITFIPLAVDNYRHRQYLPALCLCVIAVAALAISISATKDMLETLTGDKRQAQVTNSLFYQNCQGALKNLNKEIETLNHLISTDLSNGYRQRAYNQQSRMSVLREEQKKQSNQCERYAKNATSNVKISFGENLQISVAGLSITITAATGISLALHIACIVSVLAMSSWNPRRILSTNRPDPMSKNSAHNQVLSDTIDKKNTMSQKLSEDQKELYQKIALGEFGNTPAIRKLIKQKVIRGGYKRIHPVFNALMVKQILKKDGQGFVLTQQTFL